ncbi:MAG: hypothetical protein HC896_09470 [Bacteroidales bacterium]|nr:hypothetical protein [Bacteroidales bacterium]
MPKRYLRQNRAKKPKEKLFGFKPNIKGQAFWVDNKTLEFRPNDPLPPGKEYKVSFQLHRLFDVPDNIKTFEFNFQVITQSVSVDYLVTRAYNKQDLTWQQMSGELRTADYAHAGLVEQVLTATQNKKQLTISWEHFAEEKKHIFTIDSVLRTEAKETVVLSWNGKKIDSDDKGTKTIAIPPLGDFK